MKKNLLLAATVAAMMASCSSDDLSLQGSNQPGAQTEEGALTFDAYSHRGVVTRSGFAGLMDNDQLKKSQEDGGGFGVFAYKTEGETYDNGQFEPGFMYNQGVFFENGSWNYSNVKYWPNEYGSDAQSDKVDRLSFFAYAPYVEEKSPGNGKVDDMTSGITGFTSNTTKGDPYVKYITSFVPSKSVDLCWGVCGEEDTEWKIIQGAATQTMVPGLPWLDVQRPAKAIGQKMKFTFEHALAQLNVQIDADPDIEEHDEDAKIAEGTKVYVRSITFSGFAQKGALNLNNDVANVAKWEGYNCCQDQLETGEVTIFDGRKDQWPGADGGATNSEKVLGLNPTIISDDGNTTEGVTHELKNLFDNTSKDASIYVIPNDEEIKVKIVYEVETVDPKLSGKLSDNKTNGSRTRCEILKPVKFGDLAKFENGKKYILRLHLALNSVKFDADVKDWDDAEMFDGDVYLPSNVAKGVSLNKTALLLEPAETETLTATVTPSDAADKTVTWTSSDEDVAFVDDNGQITAVAEGTATITATNSTGQTATCEVTVDAINTLAKLKTYVASVDDSYLGWYVDAIGNISETDQGSSVGRIAYYGTDDVETADGTQNILVIANANAFSGYVAWKTAGGSGESAYNSTTAMNGKAFTDAYGSDAGYPAAKAAKEYSAGTPSGSTGWFLPSYAQWRKMNAAIVANSLIPSDDYWSATEYENLDYGAWGYYSNGSYSGMRSLTKDYDYYRVRAVFAF